MTLDTMRSHVRAAFVVALVLVVLERSHVVVATKLEDHACFTGVGDADTSMDCVGNDITGTIPAALAKKTQLTHLALHNNRLVGPIPPALGELTALTELYLYSNKFTGTIATELCKLTALQIFDLEKCQLTGTIPPALGGLAALTELYLFKNRLTGTIPPSLAKLTALRRVSLHFNALSGCVPGGLAPCARTIGGAPCWIAYDGADATQRELRGSNPEVTGRCAAGAENFEHFLRDNNLLQYHAVLKAAGVDEAGDLQYMEEDELLALLQAADMTRERGAAGTGTGAGAGDDDELEAFLKAHNLGRYLGALKAHGVDAVDDLQYLEEEEVEALRGMRPVHARKLLAQARKLRPKAEL